MSTATSKPEVITKQVGKLRYWISVGTFLIYMIAFFDRSNVAVLITDINFTNAFGITGDKGSQGLLLTSFLLPYGLFCFFAGPLVTKLGTRKAMMYGLIMWAVIMAVMGSASSLVVLLACRALLGIGESIVGPCVSKYVQKWYPAHERAKANGVWYNGIQLAQIVAMPLMVGFVTYLGWRGSFFALAAIGIIPILISCFYMYNKPSDHPRITQEEIHYIEAGQIEDKQETGFGSFSFWKSPPFWYVTILYTISCAFYWGVAGWLPSYLKSALGLSFAKSGFMSAVPYLVSVLALAFVTPYMDKIKRKSLFAGGSSVLFGIVLLGAMFVTKVESAVAIISLAVTIMAMIPTSCFTIMQNNIKSSEIANAVGVMNGVGYGVSSFVPYAMGVFVDMTGVPASGFFFLSSLSIIALVVWLPLHRAKY